MRTSIKATEGMILTAAQMEQEVFFVEKYFDSRIFSIYDGD